MIDKNGLDIKDAQYYHWHDLGNGNVKIFNGKWNHVFEWYTYSDGDYGWDHPKHVEVAYVDSDGNNVYHWVYDKDENGGYPKVSGDGANLVAGDEDGM